MPELQGGSPTRCLANTTTRFYYRPAIDYGHAGRYACYMRTTNEQAERKGYFEGYQSAMQDIAAANERGGIDAILEWVNDNTRPESRIGD